MWDGGGFAEGRVNSQTNNSRGGEAERQRGAAESQVLAELQRHGSDIYQGI